MERRLPLFANGQERERSDSCCFLAIGIGSEEKTSTTSRRVNGKARNITPAYKLTLNRSGKHQITWTEHGSSRTTSTGTDSRESAELFLAQFVEGRKLKPIPDQPTLSLILSGYYDDRKLESKKSIDTLFFNAKAVGKLIGKLQPQHVSQHTVRNYAKDRKNDGVSDGTIIRELACVRAAMNWAEREKWIERAPKFSMPVQPGKPRQEWATRKEVTKLIESTKASHIKLFILIAVSTGARRGAIADLKWENVDFETKRINFGDGEGNKRRALIPMNKTLTKELEYHSRIATTDYVLEYNGKPAGNIKKSFKRCAEKAGLPNITPHILRHTAATWMVMKGVSTREASRYLGMTEEIFERVYGKHSPDYLKGAAEALEIDDSTHETSFLQVVNPAPQDLLEK